MRIPKTFKLKGKTWKVRYRKLDDTCDGLCDFEYRTIYLKRGLETEKRLDVFLHEMFHATLFEAHLNEGSGLSPTAEEIVCDSATDMILSLFKISWKKAKK